MVVYFTDSTSSGIETAEVISLKVHIFYSIKLPYRISRPPVKYIEIKYICGFELSLHKSTRTTNMKKEKKNTK